MLRKKFGYDLDLKGKFFPLRDEYPILKKEEDNLMKIINNHMRSYFSKLHGESNGGKGFGTLNPLTSHLYYKISIKYLKIYVGKFL